MMTEYLSTPPTTPVMNDTIVGQLSHRTIRSFTEKKVAPDHMQTLFEVARHTATSAFMQQFTIIHITDPALREEFRQITGQPYVGGTAGELFIFIADLARNARIRAEGGVDDVPQHRTNLFLEAFTDAVLAGQNVTIAAESLGLGAVFLGSIHADPRRVIKLLKLPRLTFPVFGMLVGHPNQEPQFKPRLPLAITVGENAYPAVDSYAEALGGYDQVVQQ